MTPQKLNDVHKYITRYVTLIGHTPTAECLALHFRLPVADMVRALASWQEARTS